MDTLHENFIKQLGLKGLLVTLGSKGMFVLPDDADPILIPAIKKEIYDVCGAGDTVTAVFALALASGFSFVASAELANMAASIVVGKFGTATVTREEFQGVLNGRVGKQTNA